MVKQDFSGPFSHLCDLPCKLIIVSHDNKFAGRITQVRTGLKSPVSPSIYASFMYFMFRLGLE